MSQVANQCVYSQIQRFSLTYRKHRHLGEQLGIFLATRIFDVGLTAAAATAAAAAGANAAGATLTPTMVHTAAVGGAAKSAAMSVAGFLMLAPISTPFIILPILLSTSIATNVLLVAAVADLVLGHVPSELLIAAIVASIPLSFCLIYYFGGFSVPITFISIAIDVLGSYTFVRMAENLGYPVCSPTTAAAAAAAFSAVSSAATTLLGCCFIGRRRFSHVYTGGGGGLTSSTTYSRRCGTRSIVTSTTNETFSRPDAFGFTQGTSTSNTSGTVYISFHGLGALWDPGMANGFCGCSTSNYSDNTTTQGHSNSTTIRFG